MTGGRLRKGQGDDRSCAANPPSTGLVGRSLEGLPRRMRLLRPGEFAAVFDAGRKSIGRYMIAWTMATGGDCTRLGVVTSKRAFRRAVDRNLVRRRFRESFRRNRRRFLNGMDVVLVGRAAALTVPFCSIEREMLDLVGNSSPGARGSRR